jgi:hypothetical protein
MSFNYLGVPIGSVIAGWLATSSIDAAIALGVVSCLAAGVIAAVTIPQDG